MMVEKVHITIRVSVGPTRRALIHNDRFEIFEGLTCEIAGEPREKAVSFESRDDDGEIRTLLSEFSKPTLQQRAQFRGNAFPGVEHG